MKNDEFTNYVGTKIIKAKLSNLAEYKKEKGLEVLECDKKLEGYIVLYPPMGSQEKVYMSWSPRDVFEIAYRVVDDTEVGILL